MDVVRVDDPAYKRPLLIGTTARELTTEEIRSAYAHRWPIETNFYVAQGTCAMEMPRAWSETAVERRISLALLAGSLLKAIAAACGPLPMGPWDVKAVASAGRLANQMPPAPPWPRGRPGRPRCRRRSWSNVGTSLIALSDSRPAR